MGFLTLFQLLGGTSPMALSIPYTFQDDVSLVDAVTTNANNSYILNAIQNTIAQFMIPANATQATFGGTSVYTMPNGLNAGGPITATTGVFSGNVSCVILSADEFFAGELFAGSGGVNSNGPIVATTGSFSSGITVAGEIFAPSANISGLLQAGAASFSGSVQANAGIALGGTGAITAAASLGVNSVAFGLGGIAGTGSIQANGTGTFGGIVSTTGTFSSSLQAAALSSTGTLFVSGTSTLGGAVTMNSSLTVNDVIITGTTASVANILTDSVNSIYRAYTSAGEHAFESSSGSVWAAITSAGISINGGLNTTGSVTAGTSVFSQGGPVGAIINFNSGAGILSFIASNSSIVAIGANASGGGGEMDFVNSAPSSSGFAMAAFWQSNGSTYTERATIGNTGAYTAVSKRSMKKNIEPITFDSVDVIRRTTVVTYNLIEHPEGHPTTIGIVADDTPEEISGPNKDVFRATETTALLIDVCKKLDARLAALENK